MSNHYEAETARLFGRFVERGYVYKGARPVYWCIHDQTALAEAEVEYREHTSPSVYVKFPLSEDSLEAKTFKREVLGDDDDPRRIFFLIWTTTPWTLPANLGIAVNPQFEYSAIEDERSGEVYVVASELLAHVVEKCGVGRPADLETGAAPEPQETSETSETGLNLSTVVWPPKVLARFPGSRLDRLEARHAWLDRPSLLMLGDHVTLGGEADAETELDVREARDKKATGKAGTGLVHTAPGHGHDDFVIGKAYGLDIYCPVDNAGRFTAEVEHFAGESVFEANPAHRRVHARARRAALRRAVRASLPALLALQEPRHLPRDAAVVHLARRGARRHRARRRDRRGRPRRARTLPRTRRRRRPLCVRARCARSSASSGFPRGAPSGCATCRRADPTGASRARGCGACRSRSSTARAANRSPSRQTIDHVADIFERETTDAWYTREAAELLPEGYRCAKCGGDEFTKETDILDVWFDSGVVVCRRARKLRGACVGRPTSTSKAATSIAAGSTQA